MSGATERRRMASDGRFPPFSRETRGGWARPWKRRGRPSEKGV